MKLLNVVRSECVEPNISVDDKDAALRRVAQAAKKCTALADVDEEKILEALKQREVLGSTGFGKGIAIPHCRLSEVPEFVVGLLTVPDGVDFDAVDEEKAKVIVFIIGPKLESNEHISLLSEISHALMIPGATDEMTSAPTVEALKESFLRHSRDNVDTKDHTSKNLFHIFIQNEEIFRDVLQVFAAMEPAAISVVEGTDASEYLSKLPLFAGFWNDRERGVCHTISALVEKRFTNEIIRRIEQVTGKLDDNTEVALAVQDIFYSAGSLQA